MKVLEKMKKFLTFESLIFILGAIMYVNYFVSELTGGVIVALCFAFIAFLIVTGLNAGLDKDIEKLTAERDEALSRRDEAQLLADESKKLKEKHENTREDEGSD